MFGWNPFKKEVAPAPQAESEIEPDALALLREIVHLRDDTLGQDHRPMLRLIRDTMFLLPLSEPLRQTERGVLMRYMTFEDDQVLCAFTDPARMRDFFRDYPAQGLDVSYQSGESLGEIAQNAGFRKVILNPNSDILFAMPPLVFGAIAHGMVIGHISDEELPEGEMILGRCLAGMPPMDALDAFRVVLQQFGATEAYWAALVLAPGEMRFCIGVAAPPNAFETLPDELVSAWIGRWPMPTPLYVFPLDGSVPQRDTAFRASDRIL
jgi:hypothetical protein